MNYIKEKLTRERIILISIFLFFFVLCILTPLVGDDWKNHVISSSGFDNVLSKTIYMYMKWEGRMGSRFMIYLLTSHKIIYSLIIASLTTSSIYFVGNILKSKQKYLIYLLSFLAIALCYRPIFIETYQYVAGGSTYMVPTFLLTGYLYYYFKYMVDKPMKWYLLIYPTIMSIILPTFVEHIAVTFVVVQITLFLYHSYQEKKINYMWLCLVMLSIISTAFMIFSPGTELRNAVDGNQLSTIQTIIHNYRNFIYHTLTINAFLLLLLDMIYIILINTNLKKKISKIIASLLVIVPTLVISISQLLYNLNIAELYLKDSKTVIVYFILYTIGLLFLFFKTIKKKEYYLLLIASIMPNIAMLASPIWGGRTTFPTVILLSFLCILIITDYMKKEDKRLNIIASLLTIVVMIGYIILFTLIYQFDQIQKKEIKEHRKDSSICVYEIPKYMIGGLVPYGDYHIETYKEYYNIPKTTELKYCNIKDRK